MSTVLDQYLISFMGIDASLLISLTIMIVAHLFLFISLLQFLTAKIRT